MAKPVFEPPIDRRSAKRNYSSESHAYIYSLNPSASVRAAHIRRVFDLMELSLQRQQLDRATRCWAILVRCKEVHLSFSGFQSFARYFLTASSQRDGHRSQSAILPTRGLVALRERTLSRIAEGRMREALEDVEVYVVLLDIEKGLLLMLCFSYLPSFPYSDNPELHCCAALLALSLSHQVSSSLPLSDANSLRVKPSGPRLAEAQRYFRTALALFRSKQGSATSAGEAYIDQVLQFVSSSCGCIH